MDDREGRLDYGHKARQGLEDKRTMTETVKVGRENGRRVEGGKWGGENRKWGGENRKWGGENRKWGGENRRRDNE